MHRATLVACLLALAGCQAWAPARLDLPPDPAATQTQSYEDVTVSAAILTDQQSRAHFGADLARHGLQAVWLSVRNASPWRLRLMRGAVDPDVYSADEAAVILRKDVPGKSFEALRQYLRDESIRILLAPQTINEGFLLVPRFTVIALSLVFGLITIKTWDNTFFMITIALVQLIWGIAYKATAITGGENGIECFE